MDYITDLDGRKYRPSNEDRILAADIGKAQHYSSGARGTRGAGANLHFRIMGVLGEIIVARMLAIRPQAHNAGKPTMRADIIMPDGTQIEVKTGVPLVLKSSLKPDALYVVLDGRQWDYRVQAVNWGAAIEAAGLAPPERMTPRPGTNNLNWLIETPHDTP